jgi:anti-sigma regulatory factor (Ser/Thr protein kinase)
MPVQHWVTPSDVTHAGVLRGEVVAYAAEQGVTGAVLRDLEIAVAELVSGALLHDGAQRDAGIAVDVGPDRITVTVRGVGAGLSPQLNAPAGHLRMVLIAAVAHDVRVAHTGHGGREVSLTFLRDAEASAAP